jgi:glutathione peroxidase
MIHPVTIALLLAGYQGVAAAKAGGEPAAKTIYDFTMTDIDGHQVPLKKFKGKVILVVNVASKCGLTPQYQALQALYDDKKGKGFVILGFPANNFNAQEPGTDPEIKQFCTANYGVTFPMFSKISVKGDDEHTLYKWLIANSDRPSDNIEWNFTKFVIGRDGKVFKRIKPQIVPGSDEVKEAIDAAIAAK